ncbi:MAG: hypothetical protein ACOCRX_10590 [Candidatus Woesearchaeota archaeon]
MVSITDIIDGEENKELLENAEGYINNVEGSWLVIEGPLGIYTKMIDTFEYARVCNQQGTFTYIKISD